MPHLILEASSNIVESNDKLKQVLIDCQTLLVAKLPTKLTSCKSRALLHDLYVLSDNDVQNAFVHLTVKLLKGRTPELLQATAADLKQLLDVHFHKSNDSLRLAISVEIVELSDIYAS